MIAMRTTSILAFFSVLLLLLAFPLSLNGSLLPFLDRRPNLVTDRFPDPFQILEHVPFGLDRDDIVVSPARVDWKETPQSHSIMIDVPGLKRDELKIEVDDNRILRVSGERKKEEEKDDHFHWHCVERAYGKFWRQFRLPDNADIASIKAKLEDGVLTVTMAKLSADKIKTPRVVSIGGEEVEKGKLTGGGEDVKVDL